jgi:hypothetical protein
MHGLAPLPFPRSPDCSPAEPSLIHECAIVSRTPTMPTTGNSCLRSSQASCDEWTKPRQACGYAVSNSCNKWFSCRHQALWILGYVQLFTKHQPLAHNSQRPDGGDISLALVPRDHPVIPYASLEAEGHGLLDRLLDIIHGDHRLDKLSEDNLASLTGYSDGLVVTAALNTLGMLMHRRPIAANKILNSVFNFNPLKLANSPMTPKNKVIMKSIERTTRALLVNIMKRYVQCLLTSYVS